MALQFHKTPIVLSARTLKNLVLRYKEYTSRTDFTVIDEENYEKCRSTIALLQSGLRLIKDGRDKLEQLHAEIREEYRNCKSKSERKDLAAELEEIEAESGLNIAIAESEDLSFMLAARLDEARCAMNRMNVKLGYITQKAQIESAQRENDVVHNVQDQDGISTKSGENSGSAASTSEQNQQENSRKSSCRSIKPPQASLPKFYGKAEDFPEFWAIFETLVHKSSGLDVMEKIPLLKESLEGRAKNAIRGISLIPDNYNWIIQTLQDRYCNEPANRSKIIQRLVSMEPATDSADHCSAIIDEIQVLINQMISAGYDVRKTFDPMWCETIIAKFPQDVVKPVLISGQTQPNQTVEDLVGHLKKEIAAKLYIENRLGHAIENKPSHTIEGRYGQGIKNKVNMPRGKYSPRPHSGDDCVFCHRNNHASMTCRTVVHQSSRRNILREENRCWKCCASNHNSYDCQKPDCSLCGQKHHPSLCFKRESGTAGHNYTPWNPNEMSINPGQNSFRPSSAQNGSQWQNNRPFTTNIHTESRTPESVISQQDHGTTQLVLMTAEGNIWDFRKHEYRKVLFIFDSGAQKTIIEEKLANELGLPKNSAKMCTMSGIGGYLEHFKTNMVVAKLSTAFGEDIELNIQTKSVITNGFPSVKLITEDITFLKENNICLANSKLRGEHQRPQVLIGLDYYHNLMPSPNQPLKTPSGLHITKTVFGPTIYGKGLLKDDNFTNNICHQLTAIFEQSEQKPSPKQRIRRSKPASRSSLDVVFIKQPRRNLSPYGKVAEITTSAYGAARSPKTLTPNQKITYRSSEKNYPPKTRRESRKFHSKNEFQQKISEKLNRESAIEPRIASEMKCTRVHDVTQKPLTPTTYKRKSMQRQKARPAPHVTHNFKIQYPLFKSNGVPRSCQPFKNNSSPTTTGGATPSKIRR